MFRNKIKSTMETATTSPMKSLLKEYKELNNKSLYDNQAFVEFAEDNPFFLRIILTPTGGLYAGTKIVFRATIPKSYPNEKITIKCETKVYHPNISYTGIT